MATPIAWKMPQRVSHAPGTFGFYNNWDFKAIGYNFEQKLHQSIATEFTQEIAEPTHMQDFPRETPMRKTSY